MCDERNVRAVPNYEIECINCQNVPTVQFEDVDTSEVFEMELCGPCCWGEASMLDPDNW